MDLEGWGRLIAAVGAALAAALAPVGVIYTASINRRSKSIEGTIAYLQSELVRTKQELEQAEKQTLLEKRLGLRWYQTVFSWFNLAHEMRREALDARHLAELLAREADLPIPVWDNALKLPQIEESAPVGSKYADPTLN